MKKLILIFISLIFASIGYGQLTLINVGTNPNDHTGDNFRNAFIKTNLGLTQINTNTTAISLKLNISDTLTMLSKYETDLNVAKKLNKADSSSTAGKKYATGLMLTTGLALKLNKADSSSTAGKKYATGLMLTTGLNLKVNIADTTSMLSKYARKLSPTLTGTVSLPSTTSIGTVSSAELGYVDNVTSAIQTQLGTKLAKADSTTGASKYASDHRVDIIEIDLADYVVGIARADSSAVAKANSYATGKMLADGLALPINDNFLKGIQAMGSHTVALPLYFDHPYSTDFALTDGRAQYLAIYIPTTTTMTGAGFVQATQGDYTADEDNMFALYSVSGTTYTRVAATADDANLWKQAAFAKKEIAFTAPYVAVRGIYYLAFLYNSSAEVTPPGIYSHAILGAGANYMIYPGSNKFSFYVDAQTTLPASEVEGDVTGDTDIPSIWLY